MPGYSDGSNFQNIFRLGWEPVILTVDPEYAAYPVTDISLEEEIPPQVKVYTTKATDYLQFIRKISQKFRQQDLQIMVTIHLKGNLSVSSEVIFLFLTQEEDGINMHLKKLVR